MRTPNLYADIVPGVTAAGFFLGQSIGEFDEIVSSASRWNQSLLQLVQVIAAVDGWLLIEDTQLRSPGLERLYENTDVLSGRSLYFGKGAVRLHFDRRGVIDQIEVGEGYCGRLHGTVGVGDELKLVLQYFELEYDDVEEMHFPTEGKEVGLISFYAEEQSLSDSPNQRIHSVFVTTL